MSGILSQTIAPSPSIRWMLPARIRSRFCNDIVFVGQSFVQLHEFTDNGQLVDTTAKFDLGVQILAAGVISAKQTTVAIHDTSFGGERDEVRFTIRGHPCGDSQPPQIVVLTTSSAELVYLYARDRGRGNVHFIYAKKSLLGGVSLPERYGRCLAIEAESRAIAVAPYQDSFTILAMKDVDEIKADIDSWNPFEPAKLKPMLEQRYVQVNGVILKMDFLPSTEPNKIILLLIVAYAGKSRLLLYRWDAKEPLHTLRSMHCSGYVLRPEDGFPILLIPSSKLTSFAIVTETKFVFYDNVVSSRPARTVVDLFTAPNEDKSKLWVQWAKPIRHENYRKDKEDIILVREDGMLRTILIDYNSSLKVNAHFAPGSLGISVDTAACMLPGPPSQGGDILIAGGNMMNGAVFHLLARQIPLRLQSIPNASPVNDMIGVKLPAAKMSQKSPLVFITSSMPGARGSFMEVRYGIEAQINFTIADPESSSIDQLWVLEDKNDHRLLIISSHYEHTTVISFDLKQGDLGFADSQTHPYLSFNARTLIASCLAGGATLQITTKSIILVPQNSGTAIPLEAQPQHSYICADVDASTGLFAVVCSNSATTRLAIGVVVNSEKEPLSLSYAPDAPILDEIPTTICLAKISNLHACITGSLTGWLYIYVVDSEKGLINPTRYHIGSFMQLTETAAISSINAISYDRAQTGLIVCGLKNGRVIYMSIRMAPDQKSPRFELFRERDEVLGTTAVTIVQDLSTDGLGESGAIVVCGSVSKRIKLYPNQAGVDFTSDDIVITKRDDHSYTPATISAVQRIPKIATTHRGNLSGMLLCAAGDEIILCTLLDQPQMIPRCLATMTGPQQMVYCDYLKRFLISTKLGQNSNQSLQTERPALQVIDASSNEHLNGTPQTPPFAFGDPGDNITSLLNWTPTDGQGHFDMIIIGIQHGRDGRLLYLNAAKMIRSPELTKTKVITTYTGKPVYAVCGFGMSSLVVCAGNHLKLTSLDIRSKKFTDLSELELPSPATMVTAQGSVVYVATTLHSLMMVKVENNRFEILGADSWAGTARNVFPYENGSVLANMVSDGGSRILGFSTRPVSGSHTRFEARVPLAIDRFVQLKARPGSAAHARFQASTIDGTIYLFTTLSQEERKLLKFLERLCQPEKHSIQKKLGSRAGKACKQYGRKLEASGIKTTDPGATHVRAEIIQPILHQGPSKLQQLLGVRVKIEKDSELDMEDKHAIFDELAIPLVGKAENMVDAIVIWLRTLLQISLP